MNKVMAESSAPLARLRRRVARIEGARGEGKAARFATGHDDIDHWLGGGLTRGRLHEAVATAGEDAGAAAGFAAMLAMRAAPGRPILWLRTEAAEGRGGRLYAGGMAELGLPGAALLLGLVADETMLLRAAADAARCAGLGTLVVESWGISKLIDLTATRRLMLAAEQSGVTVLLLRIGARDSPSVADTRWRVAAAPSIPLPADAPGQPALDLELLRRRAGPAGRQWRVEWNRERRSFQIPGGTAALPGAAFPLAAH